MNSKISSNQLKRFVRHLSLVTKKYYEREKAKKSLDNHLNKIKKSSNLNKEMELLNKKINMLLEKETKVAELGLNKILPESIQKKVRLLEEQLALTQSERDKLTSDNEELKKSVDSLSNLKSTFDDVDETKDETERRVQAIEDKVDNKYREFLIRELDQKISLLESNYQRISKDKSISPNRLYKIEEKLKAYKAHLRKMKSL